MRNREIAAIFEEIADLLEMQGGNPFRIRSYQSAARTIGDTAQPIEDMVAEGRDLTSLPSIGKSHAEKIQEILETGTCERLEELRKNFPEHLTELLDVQGLGAKKVQLLHRELGVKDLESLKKAAEEGRIRDLPGMGAKTEENILKGLQTLAAESGRIGIKVAVEHVDDLGKHLDGIKEVKRWCVAGSFRRRRETIGDLDILVEAGDRKKASEKILEHRSVAEVMGRGEEKVTVRLRDGLQIDFRYFDAKAFGAAMMYFTGSKAHNIRLRKRAQGKKWKLNEYGLFRGKKRLAGRTEEDVYEKLGLPWIPPELREDRGEVQAAEDGELPRLIEPGDLRGELHSHTDESDGHHSVEDMAEAAQERNYQYLAITDHSKAVTVAKGLDEKRLRKHADRIHRLNESLDELWLLAGIEVDILKDGRLDLSKKVLAELDWVVASVHSYFNLDEKAMTERIVRALESGVVHCLGHPFGRLIGQRDPIRFDVDRVLDVCKEQGIFLEINAHPDRLDLPDTYCKRAREKGLKMVIATDAHRQSDLDLSGFGVSVARRGWLTKSDVLNTLTAARLRKRLGRT